MNNETVVFYVYYFFFIRLLTKTKKKDCLKQVKFSQVQLILHNWF